MNTLYRLLALTIATSLGSATGGIMMQRLQIAPFYILLGSALVQSVGLILLSSLHISSQGIQAVTYGYEVILGIGVSSGLATAVMMVPLVVDRNDSGESKFFWQRGIYFWLINL